MSKRVYSVTISGRNDCVALTEWEAMTVKMKFMPEIEMFDMTEKHGMQVEHLHKLERMQQTGEDLPDYVSWTGPIQYTKGVGPGMYGGAAKIVWEYEDLMKM